MRSRSRWLYAIFSSAVIFEKSGFFSSNILGFALAGAAATEVGVGAGFAAGAGVAAGAGAAVAGFGGTFAGTVTVEAAPP